MRKSDEMEKIDVKDVQLVYCSVRSQMWGKDGK